MFQQNHLAQNIRKYRLLHGLTQAQLAQSLFVTAQNVSKWETGKSVPDLENLCMLSQVLRVSTDRLLGRNELLGQRQVLVAIDGSSTKTEFLLFTEQGDILECFCLQGSNPNHVGLEKAQSLLKSGIEQLMAVNAGMSAVYASIAGCDNTENQRVLQNYLRKLCSSIPCQVDSDVLNVIYSAPVKDRCIVVICGADSVAYAKTPGLLQRVGGCGSLFESSCSDYNFGRDALLAALKARSGLSNPTVIMDLVEDSLGSNIRDKLNDIYKLSREEIGSYAKLVFDAYFLEDETAVAILENNTQQLALLINTVATNYDCGTDVVLAGDLLSQKETLMHHLQPKLQPELKVHFSTQPQICGAAARCCKLAGVEAPKFEETLYKNYLQVTHTDIVIPGGHI